MFIYGFTKTSLLINRLLIIIAYGICKIKDDLIPGFKILFPTMPIPKCDTPWKIRKYGIHAANFKL